MAEIIAAVIVSNFLIFIFYRFFQTAWPEEYFTEDDRVGLVISLTPLRFVLFRLFPVFILTSFMFATFKLSYNWVNLGLIGMLSSFLHLATTNFVAIIKIFSKSDSVKVFLNKGNQIFYHFITIISVLAVGFAAGYVSTSAIFKAFAPTRQGIIDNIWSSVIYSVIIVKTFRYYTLKKEKSIESIIENSRTELLDNSEIMEVIKNESIKNKANPTLIEAVCIAENIQRPKWVRRVELLFPKASYGIMQVKSDKKLSDLESIVIGTKKYFSNTESLFGEKNFEDLILKYNPSHDYVKLIHKIIYEIDQDLFKKISSSY